MLAEVRAGPGASGEDRPAPGRGLQCGPPKGPGTGLEMPDQLNSDLVKVSAPGAAPEPREPRKNERQYERENVGAWPKQETHLRLRLQRLLLPLSLLVLALVLVLVLVLVSVLVSVLVVV